MGKFNSVKEKSLFKVRAVRLGTGAKTRLCKYLGDTWKPNCAKPWATCHNPPYYEHKVRLHDIHRSLPTYRILILCF